MAPAHYIPVFPTSHSADFSTSSCSYSLCTVWICQLKEGHSYVFSRWIWSYILPVPCDELYSGSHYTHQSHISGPLDTPTPPLRCNSARIGAPQFLSALRSLDYCSCISLDTEFPPAHLHLDCRFYIECRTLYPTLPSPFSAPPLVSVLLNTHLRSVA